MNPRKPLNLLFLILSLYAVGCKSANQIPSVEVTPEEFYSTLQIARSKSLSRYKYVGKENGYYTIYEYDHQSNRTIAPLKQKIIVSSFQWDLFQMSPRP